MWRWGLAGLLCVLPATRWAWMAWPLVFSGASLTSAEAHRLLSISRPSDDLVW